MNRRHKYLFELLAFVGIVGLFVLCSHLLRSQPNLKPYAAFAMLGGFFFSRRYFAWLLPVAAVIASYSGAVPLGSPIMYTVLGCLLLAPYVGGLIRARNQKLELSRTRQAAFSLTGALWLAIAFFVVTNFVVWLLYYEQTWGGFSACYVAAIPFFRNTLLGNVVFVAIGLQLIWAADLIPDSIRYEQPARATDRLPGNLSHQNKGTD